MPGVSGKSFKSSKSRYSTPRRRHPLAHPARRRMAEQVRPEHAAHARFRGRTHQSRGVDLVSSRHRQGPLSHRGHMVADRDRRHPHQSAARRAHAQPGSANKPFFGVEPVILRDDGKEVGINEGGKLCIKKPWPGMMRTTWGDHNRFIETTSRCIRTFISPATAAG